MNSQSIQGAASTDSDFWVRAFEHAEPIVVSAEVYDEFVALLDREPVEKPRLRALLAGSWPGKPGATLTPG